MSEEIVAQAAEDTALEAVVDNAAEGTYESEVFQEAEEEVVAAEEEVVAAEEDPDDNAERSRLGRKVKYLEDTVNQTNQQLLDQMDQLKTMMYYRGGGEAPVNQQDDPDDEGIVYTRDDIRKEMSRIQQEEQRANTSYNTSYTQTIGKLSSDLSEDEFNEIDKEFRSNHNFRHSNDPMADAERNWFKAERAILRKKMASPKKVIPLKREIPSAPLGGASPSKTPDKPTTKIKLDDAARDFMKRSGMSEEKAMAILARG